MNDINEEIHAQLEDMRLIVGNIRRVVPFVWVLLVGAFGLGGWVASLQLKTNAHDQITVANAKAVNDFALWRERTEASRYTSQDAAKLSETMSNLINNQDKRLQRTEDSLDRIDKSLQRIEQKLNL